MTQVEIYTKPTCGFCHAAKRLLTGKGVSFAEVNITAQPDKRPEMIDRAAGRTTVPQIFINGVHLGGYDDLAAADHAGSLDKLLAG